MDTLDSQVLNAALRWAAKGHRFALVTVARTWGSAPRPPGAWMLLRDDGLVEGSVSGGCIEDDLISRMLEGEFKGSKPLLLRYGVSKDEATRFGLPCGGNLELLLEPECDVGALRALHALTQAGKMARRVINVNEGSVTILEGSRTDQLSWNGNELTTLHGPRLRMLLIGAGQISRFIAPLALGLGYEVLVCDPREEYTQEWDVPGTRLLPGMPDDVVNELNMDVHSAVIALTHDPKLDDMALMEALKSDAFYVGALGSVRNNATRRERLMTHFELTQAEVDRLHGPVGLPIGSRTPPEIAVAVLAEITAVKNHMLRQSEEALAARCAA